MGKSSQAKGAEGERELARILAKEGYCIMRGGASYGTLPDLIGLPGIHIEVKRVEKLNITEAMHQAERDAERFNNYGIPVVFHRKNREKWLVTMNLTDWLEIYKHWSK